MSVWMLASPGVAKEIRALLPTWLASVVAILAAAVVPEAGYSQLPSFAFLIGMLALGAQSVGHEYTHRTLAVFLSLPSDRRRLLLNKLAVLIVMLLTLTALAWRMLFSDPEFVRRIDSGVLAVGALAAFFLAPWLTMMCRNSLAGIVFSIAVPAMLLIAGDLIGVAMYGTGGGAPIDNFKFAFLWRSLFIVCTVAAISSWHMFARLEAIDGPSADIQAPEWLLGDVSTRTLMPPRRHHPYWLLARKELRLQQMTFVVVAIFTAAWVGLTLLARLTPQHLPLIPIDAIAALYFAILTLLIGSLASAEERQMGTLEWQRLLPIASWKQWLIKVAIVFGLVSLLGILLPAIVMGKLQRPRDIVPMGFILVVTTISLYVSSLSTSGVKAMVVTLPATIGLIAVVNLVTLLASRAGVRITLGFVNKPTFAATLVAGFMVVALRFAYVNHRSTERRVGRVLWQTSVLAASLVVGLVALGL